METVTIEGVTLYLTRPDRLSVEWVGQEDLIDQVLAAWLIVEENDLPLHPRLIGKPGVGKTTLAYAAAQRLGKETYFFQATMDTRPEDLIVTPVIAEQGKIRYMASPLVTAMIRGGRFDLRRGQPDAAKRAGPRWPRFWTTGAMWSR
jgi:MoxR-like ATPase